MGSALHDGIEAWYDSRCRDGEDTGEPNVDRAVAASETAWANRAQELFDPTEVPILSAATIELIRRYHEYFGPGGPLQEFPSTKVLIDSTGEPWIERHFEIDLGDGWTYTSRIDLVVEHRGFIAVMDHKSSKASFVKNLLAMAELEAQFTGELLCLQEVAPDLSTTGILVNVLVKDRKKGPPFDRAMLPRSPEQLMLYAHHTKDLFERIKAWRDKYQRLMDEGYDQETAFQHTWPMDGLRHGACFSYFRKCEFWDLCRTPGLASRLIEPNYRPRTKIVNELNKEPEG